MSENTGAAESIEAVENNEIDADVSTAETVSEESKPEAQEEGQQESDSEDNSEERTFSQKELDEILEKRLARQSRKADRAKEREMSELNGKLEALAAMLQSVDDGDDVDDDNGDLTADDIVNKALEKLKAEQRAEQQASKAKSIFAEAKELNPNFDFDDFNDSVYISPDLADAIIGSDFGAKIVNYFDDKPDEADRLSAMSEKEMLRAFGRLEARFEAESESKAAKVPEKPLKTGAPDPIKPIKGGKNEGKPEFYAGMSDAEYKRVMEAKLKKK